MIQCKFVCATRQIKSQALEAGFLIDVKESGNLNFRVERVGMILEIFESGEGYVDDSRFYC